MCRRGWPRIPHRIFREYLLFRLSLAVAHFVEAEMANEISIRQQNLLAVPNHPSVKIKLFFVDAARQSNLEQNQAANCLQ